LKKALRIGTRNSPLALWQAQQVKTRLQDLGFETVLVPVTSDGDLNLQKPLYELGITGIFTKTLDLALLNGEIDIAVHSLKDVPTLLPKGLVETAVLERGSHSDVLVPKEGLDLGGPCTIATGSLRRKAQWLYRYPHHKVVGLRGNVNTRLQRLEDSDWQGAVFAKAGLERIDLLPKNAMELEWMIPAPAQGAMVIVANENDVFAKEASALLNHVNSRICTYVEREFLRILEGGCTAPIGALAKIERGWIHFHGMLLAIDGTAMVQVQKKTEINSFIGFGKSCAEALLGKGGKPIMEQIKKTHSH